MPDQLFEPCISGEKEATTNETCGAARSKLSNEFIRTNALAAPADAKDVSGERRKPGDHSDKVAAPKQAKEGFFAGSLFLIGGCADESFSELVRLAGKNSKVAVIGRASRSANADEQLALEFFKAGVKLEDITIVVPKEHKTRNSLFQYSYDVPSDVGLVYFGGGKQDKLRDEFDERQLGQVRDLLRKGAIIAGNSAGAAVMSGQMINGGDQTKLHQAPGFGLVPWVIDTHVGERHREGRDVKALYEIGNGKVPVIGLDADTRVRFFWKGGQLKGEVGGHGNVRIFQSADMPLLKMNRDVMPRILTDNSNREACVWELKPGDVFNVPGSATKKAKKP